MPFPESARVIYQKNPIDRVICQIRFPPILKIDTEEPSLFQESIRECVPEYQVKIEHTPGFSIQPTVGMSNDVAQTFINATATKNHEFFNSETGDVINLTRTFLAFTVSKYERWESYLSKLLPAISSFEQIYKPAFYSRIGLRYVDVINRKALGLESKPWRELIKPEVTGIIGSDLESSVISFQNVSELALKDDSGMLRIASSHVLHNTSGAKCILIDSDFYSLKRTPITGLNECLERMHSKSGRFLRWAISNDLHQALGPVEP